MKSIVNLLKQNKYYFLIILLLVLVGGIFLLTNTKVNVTLWVNKHYTQFLDLLFYNTNYIGEVFFTVALVFIILILKGWRLALKASTCFVAVLIVTQFIKLVLFKGSLRPTLYFSEFFPHIELRLLDGVIQLKTETFPSGHTSAAFAIMTFLALYWKNKKLNWLLALGGLSVAYARLYLSQHFITDVYVGMIIGVAMTSLVYCYYPNKWLIGKEYVEKD